MDSNKLTIELVVSLLKEYGIRKIVISPGGTNIAFIKAIENDTFFQCYSVVDERSALYFAIGLYLQTGEVIATSCTSAQATRNYVPGLTEAFYKKAPILAITMSKHPRFTGQEYMQAPNQCSLPEDSVKASYWLPYISDTNDYLYAKRMVNESILKLRDGGNGPVQLCIPWLDFPITSSQQKLFPIKSFSYEDEWQSLPHESRILLIIGEHLPFDSDTKKAIELFTERYNCAVYVTHLSNYSGNYSIDASLELTQMTISEFNDKFSPDVMITIGGQTGDYSIYKMMSKMELAGIQHWRVATDSQIVDTYDKLTSIYQCSEKYFMLRYAEKVTVTNDHSYYQIWKTKLEARKTEMDYPFSNVYAANVLHKMIPVHSVMQFSILNSLRVWNCFTLDPTVQCYSNVGAFGIDGGLSTLIGQSMATDELCFMIIGDLAFYYDMNALGIRHIKNNLRILLVNNNGGIEFKLWEGENVDTDRYIAAAGHFQNAKGWAETCGIMYLSAHDQNEFRQHCKTFVSKSDTPILLELFVSDTDESEAYKALIRNNETASFSRTVKNGLKSILKRK